MKNLTYINTLQWVNNEPMDSESFPENGILPDRFGTLSEPTEIPIVSDDLNSITKPLDFESDNQEKVLM